MKTVKIGVGGPVGSGKTALLNSLCKRLQDQYGLAVITNDIYTFEDAEFLVKAGALPAERIRGVQTGGCPHTAIREDTSVNQEAVDEMLERFPNLDILFLESGGDNLAASFSPELVDVSIYVVDVSGGDKVPRKGNVDRFAGGQVLMSSTSTHFPDHHWPRMDAKAHGELHAFFTFQAWIELRGEGLDNPQTSVCGSLRVILMRLRPAKVDQEPVTKILGHMAAILLNNLGGSGLIGAGRLRPCR